MCWSYDNKVFHEVIKIKFMKKLYEKVTWKSLPKKLHEKLQEKLQEKLHENLHEAMYFKEINNDNPKSISKVGEE